MGEACAEDGKEDRIPVLMAFVSDIHGNLPALEAAVLDAKARGAGRIVCAGDMTGYGPFPEGVCRFLEAGRIPTIIGNYDRKVLEVVKQGPSAAAGMKQKKRRILLWTVAHLDDRSRRYLASLPDHLTLRLPDKYNVLVVHGSPLSLDDAIYPSITRRGLEAKLGGVRPDVLVCGHTHLPFVKRIDGVLIANCGSAGHPVDGDPRPAYALVHAEEGAVPRGRIVRFEYDRNWTIAALQKTSLPEGLQKDFAEGAKMRFLE
jgi:putative phosphoesterase